MTEPPTAPGATAVAAVHDPGATAVAAVHDPSSVGVHTYVQRLSAALANIGIEYRSDGRFADARIIHFHLANSTRRILPRLARQQGRFLVTVHDILPRVRMLRPLHAGLVLPMCIGRAWRVVVHSHHAADLLRDVVAAPAGRIEIIPHPAPAPETVDRGAARTRIGLDPEGPPVFTLPGTLKPAKLVNETISALEPLLATGRARLILAGHVSDERVVRRAQVAGALVLRDPTASEYQAAVVAADAVVCLRADSVGESNGPLLDAIGAGRPSLVTRIGSAGEIGGASVFVVEPTVPGIRAGVEVLLDEHERAWRAEAAVGLAAEFTWQASAQRHAELFEELARD